jgi:hypothetical protein
MGLPLSSPEDIRVTAVSVVRKMRGRTQAHLLLADDGNHYVVKFQNNPFGVRALINEFLSSSLLRHLGLSCPVPAQVSITPEFLRNYPLTGVLQGGAIEAPVVGIHYGSQYPGDPKVTAVYDFIPDALLNRIDNLPEFAGMLLVDKWAGNTEPRQAIFLRKHVNSHQVGKEFTALMIDHERCFAGKLWEFKDIPGQSHYFRPSVYKRVHSWVDFEPWLTRTTGMPDVAIRDLAEHIPQEWISGYQPQFEQLLLGLIRRREQLESMIWNEIAAFPEVFSNWRIRQQSYGQPISSHTDLSCGPTSRRSDSTTQHRSRAVSSL